ncbi:DUF883 family protein [Arhodomonas sp. AD133]|uniref:DUF883 family protein n=1 Tax=Arhodomonas sp. AD133 TaxID=3415009 RepID=UPI003EB773BE
MSDQTSTPMNEGAGDERHRTTERLASAAHETVDRLAERGGYAEERIRERGADAASRVNEARQRARSEGEEVYEQLNGYLRTHPYTSLGIAAAAGFIVGALLRRR